MANSHCWQWSIHIAGNGQFTWLAMDYVCTYMDYDHVWRTTHGGAATRNAMTQQCNSEQRRT